MLGELEVRTIWEKEISYINQSLAIGGFNY